MIELMVATAILGVVLLAILTSLDSFTRATTRTQRQAVSLGQVRTGLEQITRDLRAANPITAIDPVSTYANSVTFDVYCAAAGSGACGSNNLRTVTYRLNNYALEQVTGGVTRTLVGPTETPSLAVARRQGAVLNTSSQPVFRYYKADGTALTTGVPSSKYRDCTKYVEIHVVAAAEPNRPSNTINLVTRADLRNFNEVTGC